ncbi:hypothetical protein BDV98DRAFT_520829 [Pterulicium gracile]|uniref:Uncharacterized protein n=1 Tax=Pterulicium gracile TaxID=1884261 RepID=A0A5C3R236_9AGAR|nr:hypothetical protein BDV98DRAFT_520829 [Pterula gracilis]
MNNTNQPKKETKEALRNFIAVNPSVVYTFDSERDAPESEICREQGPKGRECMILQMQSKQLFEAMQNHGFFCALPMDPSRTHMECKPIPKS